MCVCCTGPGNGRNGRRGTFEGRHEEHRSCAPQQWNWALRQNPHHTAVHISQEKRFTPVCGFCFVFFYFASCWPERVTNASTSSHSPAGIGEENLAKLIQHANIQSDSNIIYNLQNLGCNVLAGVHVWLCSPFTHLLLCRHHLIVILSVRPAPACLLGSQLGEKPAGAQGAHGEHLPALQMDTSHQRHYGGIHQTLCVCFLQTSRISFLMPILQSAIEDKLDKKQWPFISDPAPISTTQTTVRWVQHTDHVFAHEGLRSTRHTCYIFKMIHRAHVTVMTVFQNKKCFNLHNAQYWHPPFWVEYRIKSCH